jgi:hypothetical protein
MSVPNGTVVDIPVRGCAAEVPIPPPPIHRVFEMLSTRWTFFQLISGWALVPAMTSDLMRRTPWIMISGSLVFLRKVNDWHTKPSTRRWDMSGELCWHRCLPQRL